jgi:hypothetical protein
MARIVVRHLCVAVKAQRHAVIKRVEAAIRASDDVVELYVRSA